MSNLLDLAKLDSRLQEIFDLLESGKSVPVVRTAVDQFVTDYSPSEHWGLRSLFSPDCREVWTRSGRYVWGNKLGAVKELNPYDSRGCPEGTLGRLDRQIEARREKLISVCVETLRFLLDSHCPVSWEKHSEQLREALRLYLSARGYPVVSSPPAAKTEQDKGNGGDDSTSWVPANQLWTEKFTSNKELTKFRQQHPEMFRNPSRYKLEIHAGLWARYWADHDKAGFEALDGNLPSVADDPTVQEDALEAAMQRAARVRAKKEAGKQ
jgi:hypothetical protein